ncbi:MAG TPA: pirin family protein [Bdellovibrionales bacterium]|nr:pirin family protein [Bdellovibrionales bacterium]
MDKIIAGRKRDLGGFIVERALPTVEKRAVGPFVFLDHMGPLTIDERHKLDVRPHPHIGLATVTYLFEGCGMHRDTLGSKQLIQPGDMNWMTAGRGIAHSERTPAEALTAGGRLHGVQIWVGLPSAEEECEPAFTHWPHSQLPFARRDKDVSVRVMLGEFEGTRSPVPTLSPMLFLDVDTKTSAELRFQETEVAVFLVAGAGAVNGQAVNPSDLAVLGDPSRVRLEGQARWVVIGGEPFPEKRHMWWNFVSSRPERIRRAAEEWRAGRFGSIDGETEFIPLPDSPPFPT